MKIHRFITDFKISQNTLIISHEATIHQIGTVLRLHPDEQIIVSDGKKPIEYTVSLTESHKKNVEGIIISKKEVTPTGTIDAYIAILKNDNFDLLVQKIVELGVESITPIITDRTIKKSINKKRIESIIKEACEQSGQSVIPKLHEPIAFAKSVEHALKKGEVFFFDMNGETLPENILHKPQVFIGPEGGWSDKEIELIKNKHIPIYTLGKTTLRAETAGIVSVFAVNTKSTK